MTDDDDPPLQLTLGDLYLRRKDVKKALPLIQKFLADQPDYPPALRFLTRAYELNGQFDEADKTLDALTQGPPDAIELRVRQIGRMEQAEDTQGRYRDQIEVANRLLGQREDWAARAEWEVSKSEDGWEVIAWRVEHPECKGPNRYLPWGYSVIELDSRMIAIDYHRKG